MSSQHSTGGQKGGVMRGVMRGIRARNRSSLEAEFSSHSFVE